MNAIEIVREACREDYMKEYISGFMDEWEGKK